MSTADTNRVDDLLAEHGWTLPADPLAPEVIAAAVTRWGIDRVTDGLRRRLTSDAPSYALEPIGAALGEAFECPHQLVRIDP